MGILLSALELAIVEDGRAATEVLASTATVTTKLEELGYHRVWIAEHHGSPAIATASPPVLAAHLAAVTSSIRIGSGGVMAPNHAPLAVAEQFATLSALHPGRIDLGVGRGPGTFDEKIVRALRRGADPATDEDYRADVAELLRHLAGETGIRVLPGEVPTPEPWLLCSSAAGAGLAAELGLPIAVAHHIRPQNTAEVLRAYRENFKPSQWREEPYVILCVETICADTDAEAAYVAGPCAVIKSYLLNGEGGDLAFPTREQAAAHEFTPESKELIAQFTAAQAHGGPEKVVRSLKELAAATGADELMLTAPVYDAAARARSYELVAKAF
ncbi:LLM class flavin-dependent oxidoreductase [Amycolatopsis sp. NPDC058340]|uniref:LLM class flavin-dependent oxidoreductase n=1 Tax=Amycolatopsis sp. NPDC058340 TaxID=3346453 RepID=UPI003668B2D2